jgi:hypothetical protein
MMRTPPCHYCIYGYCDNVRAQELIVLKFSLLQQRDSWNYIQISMQGMLALWNRFEVFQPFWDIMEGFGLKFAPENENHIDCRGQLSLSNPW